MKKLFLFAVSLAAIAAFIPTMAAAQSPVVLYDETFTGADLNDEVTLGNATYPAADNIVVSGARLDLSPVTGASAGVLFRMPILTAGDLTGLVDLVVTVTIDWLQLTSDNDFGVAVSDGTWAIGGMQQDSNCATNLLDFADSGTELGYSQGNVNPSVCFSPPETYVINVADIGGNSTVRITNSTGQTFLYPSADPVSPLDYSSSIDFLLVGNDGHEVYGIESVSIRAEALRDGDGDGVLDDDDFCPGTVIPEGVPTVVLNPNHWALTVDGNGFDFDTVIKGKGKGPNRSYTIEDTAGCSCEQIIEMQGLGLGHTYHGCSISAMDDWVEAMNTP